MSSLKRSSADAFAVLFRDNVLCGIVASEGSKKLRVLFNISDGYPTPARPLNMRVPSPSGGTPRGDATFNLILRWTKLRPYRL